MGLQIAILLLLFCLGSFADSETVCTTYSHCYDGNNDKIYKDGNAWISVNLTEGTCAECICMESKEYTVSCVELEVVNKTSLKSVRKNKSSSLDPQKKSETAIPKEEEINRIEIELTESEAFKIRCQKGVVPTHDPAKEVIVVLYKHYFFMSRIMYCCKKESYYKSVDTGCKVVFDDFCNSRVVDRNNEEIDCEKPFEFL